MTRRSAAQALFVLGCAFSASPWGSPPLALVAGILLALTLENPFPTQSKTASKWMLQAAVVLLGFSLDLQKIFRAGQEGLLFALVSISAVFLLGYLLQRILHVKAATSLLVSTGTAICGGSAIAAMSSVINAPQEDVSVAVGTVFLLNAVALFCFPPIGRLLQMTPVQFGTWGGIAIHDVSSVVGAATVYKGALETATAVKLSRVLFIIPISLIAAFVVRKREIEGNAKLQIPWFVGLFILAAIGRSYWPAIQDQAASIKLVATAGFSLSLFLIGAGISRATLKGVGIRPMVQGVALWMFISLASLWFVLNFVRG